MSLYKYKYDKYVYKLKIYNGGGPINDTIKAFWSKLSEIRTMDNDDILNTFIEEFNSLYQEYYTVNKDTIMSTLDFYRNFEKVCTTFLHPDKINSRTAGTVSNDIFTKIRSILSELFKSIGVNYTDLDLVNFEYAISNIKNLLCDDSTINVYMSPSFGCPTLEERNKQKSDYLAEHGINVTTESEQVTYYSELSSLLQKHESGEDIPFTTVKETFENSMDIISSKYKEKVESIVVSINEEDNYMKEHLSSLRTPITLEKLYDSLELCGRYKNLVSMEIEKFVDIHDELEYDKKVVLRYLHEYYRSGIISLESYNILLRTVNNSTTYINQTVIEKRKEYLLQLVTKWFSKIGKLVVIHINNKIKAVNYAQLKTQAENILSLCKNLVRNISLYSTNSSDKSLAELKNNIDTVLSSTIKCITELNDMKDAILATIGEINSLLKYFSTIYPSLTIKDTILDFINNNSTLTEIQEVTQQLEEYQKQINNNMPTLFIDTTSHESNKELQKIHENIKTIVNLLNSTYSLQFFTTFSYILNKASQKIIKFNEYIKRLNNLYTEVTKTVAKLDKIKLSSDLSDSLDSIKFTLKGIISRISDKTRENESFQTILPILHTLANNANQYNENKKLIIPFRKLVQSIWSKILTVSKDQPNVEEVVLKISKDIADAKSELDTIDHTYDVIKRTVINANNDVQDIYRRIEVNEYFEQLDVIVLKNIMKLIAIFVKNISRIKDRLQSFEHMLNNNKKFLNSRYSGTGIIL